MQSGDLAGAGDSTLRTTLAFGLSQIPSGSVITGASLSLYQMGQAGSGTTSLDAHYLNQDWTQGSGMGEATGDGATWQTYDGASDWTNAGGDYYPVASANVPAPDSTGTWVDWDLTDLVQDWVDGTVNNYGVLIKQAFENPGGADITPPNIGDIRTENVTSTDADIIWSTDEEATSQVDFGTTTSYGSTTPVDTNLSNQHSTPLSGLTGDTIYHYRVRSVDLAGNETMSDDHVLQTATRIIIQPDPAAGYDDFFQSNQQNSNSGAAVWMLLGDYPAGFLGSVRGTLKFDLSSIPADAIVRTATLSLYQQGQMNSSTPTFDLHYLTSDWAEGTGVLNASGDGATWRTYDGVNEWDSPGGDFNSAPSSSAVSSGVAGTWVNWDVSDLAQSWVDGSITNYGCLIKKDVENPATFDLKFFYSSDYTGDPMLRPKLVIEYVPPPGTITMTINETYNRDGSSGAGSVGFGNVSAGSSFHVGDASNPPYAVKLSVKSNSEWGLKVSATGDLEQIPPLNEIDISNLAWKQDADPPGSYQPFTKQPAETTIASNEPATNGISYFFDYRLAVPALATTGNYSATVVYTAYPE
jgi:hypothetical protein